MAILYIIVGGVCCGSIIQAEAALVVSWIVNISAIAYGATRPFDWVNTSVVTAWHIPATCFHQYWLAPQKMEGKEVGRIYYRGYQTIRIHKMIESKWHMLFHLLCMTVATVSFLGKSAIFENMQMICDLGLWNWVSDLEEQVSAAASDQILSSS